MEEKRASRTWLWIVLAIVAGLVMFMLGGAVGGVAGYVAGRASAVRALRPLLPTPVPLQPRQWPTPQSPIPELPPVAGGGIVVVEVIADSPAEEAGLRQGDLITEVDGRIVDADTDLSAMVMQHRPGDRLELTIERRGRERTVEVTLGRNPDKPGQVPWLGIRFQNMVPRLEPRLGTRVPAQPGLGRSS